MTNDDVAVATPSDETNEERPGRSLVSERLNVPVALGNDANVGLLGEWVNGVAQGRSNVLGVWMGTGIGAGLILDGRPYIGSMGGAGEFGHMIIRADGALCSCGRRAASRRTPADAEWPTRSSR